MKKNNQKIFSIGMHILILIYIFLPWFEVKGRQYNVFGVYTYAKTLDGFDMTIFHMQIMVLVLYMVLSVLYMITVLLNKKWHLNIVCMIVTLVHAYFFSDGLTLATGSFLVTLYVNILFLLNLVEFVIPKMRKSMQESRQEAGESAKRDKTYQQEKKIRLHFEGRYTNLFYQMIWKNFTYNWRDYGLFIICGVMVAAFSFAGLGSYEMMTKVHSKEGFVIQTGLGGILLNAMIPIAICAAILMVYVLIFYMKKRFLSYSMFFQLGSRKKTVYTMLGIEILLSFLTALIVGCLLGNLVLFLFRNGVKDLMGEGAFLASITWKTYVKMPGVVAGIYFLSIMAARDIALDLNVVSATARKAQGEVLPRKGLKPLTIVGGVIMIGAVFSFCQIRNFENIKLVVLFFAGAFLFLRFGMAMYLNRAKKGPKYLERLMNRHQLYYKSKTTTWYLLAVSLISTCAVFYFTMQTVSAMLTEDMDKQYPYDFVCIVDDQDNSFFEQLEKKYDIEMTTYPMVRISSSDGTQRLELSNEHSPQGQHIGVSETTYHALKQALYPFYEEQPLELDPEGNQIYVVYQQAVGDRVQPLDWQIPRTTSYLHIGLPCIGSTKFVMRGRIDYPARKITGKEITSLTGSFRQGMQENVIVFSDEYFAEAQEYWKYTNPYTGILLKGKNTQELDLYELKTGPTKLVLIHAKAEDLDAIEEEMQTLKQMPSHVEEASYNSEISCYYSKQTAVADYKTERVMKIIVNGLVIVMFLIAYILFMSIKVYSEMEEKTKRAEFLKTMGMPRKERIKMLKGEIYMFFWVPAVITVITTIGFMGATFYARMYTGAVIRECLSLAVWIWAVCFLIEFVTIGVLSRLAVRKVEGKHE